MNPLTTGEHPPYYFQKFRTNLYVAQSGKADKGWCGYILRADEAQKTDKITLTDALSKYHGTYLFASIAPRLDSILEIENLLSKVKEERLISDGFVINSSGGNVREAMCIANFFRENLVLRC